jgi:hypothetical protein
VLSAAVGGCSYQYELIAVARNGGIAFIVDPRSSDRPECLRDVEVSSQHAVMWSESVSYDEACANRFPLAYGVSLSGHHLQDRDLVKPKPLQRNVVYEVGTTTGATGYGSGRFLIHSNGRVENLPLRNAEQEGLISNSGA